MAHQPAPTPAPDTPVVNTTRRGIAAASVCLGLWACLTFWWYPFGIMVGTVALTLGLIARVLGWRVTKHESNLAFVGIMLGVSAIGMAVTTHRVFQYYFEGQLALTPFTWLTGPR